MTDGCVTVPYVFVKGNCKSSMISGSLPFILSHQPHPIIFIPYPIVRQEAVHKLHDL